MQKDHLGVIDNKYGNLYGGKSSGDHGYLLLLWSEYQGSHGQQASARLSNCHYL